MPKYQNPHLLPRQPNTARGLRKPVDEQQQAFADGETQQDSTEEIESDSSEGELE